MYSREMKTKFGRQTSTSNQIRQQMQPTTAESTPPKEASLKKT